MGLILQPFSRSQAEQRSRAGHGRGQEGTRKKSYCLLPPADRLLLPHPNDSPSNLQFPIAHWV